MEMVRRQQLIALLLFLRITHCQAITDEYEIKHYEKAYDYNALKSLLFAHSHELDIEKISHGEVITHLEKQNLFIMKKAGDVIGFVAFYSVNQYLLTFFIQRLGIINGIAIAQPYEHKGYGKKLLLFALDKLKKEGCTNARLRVMNDNMGAQKFYERNHFIKVRQKDRESIYNLSLPCVQENRTKYGNIIQRYPETCLSGVSFLVLLYLLWKWHVSLNHITHQTTQDI